MFVYCEACGKKLIERKGNGLWCFQFGKRDTGGDPVVHMEIFGSIKMVCTKRSCKHINILNYFPGCDTLNEKQ